MEYQGGLYQIWKTKGGWNVSCIGNRALVVKSGLKSYKEAVQLALSLESDAEDFVERY